jgi:signal transduction histidine kinase/CheY-like chemotaxis protein
MWMMANRRPGVTNLILLLYATSIFVWILDDWRPWAGQWGTTLAWIAVIYLASRWLDLPQLVSLLALPGLLLLSPGGLRAAVLVAIGESLLLVMSLRWPAAGLSPSGVAIAVAGIWGVLAVVWAMYRPVRQLVQWTEDHYAQARLLFEDTQRKRLETDEALENLRQANRQLALSNERIAALRRIAEDAERAKNVFVANVSHEFRTPLNMIIGLVEIMVESPELYAVALSPRMREDLNVVHRNCRHLARMINDVLDLTRAQAGRMRLKREPVKLQEIVETSVTVVQPLLREKHLALQLKTQDDLPEIYCDHTRIQQVILNLLSNAARYTEEGGITLEVAAQDRYVVVSVTDTGPGIAPQDIEHIFEPFSQSSGGLWQERGGSGLGLSISRQFIRLHGGRLWVESQLGVGTSFYFTLPLSAPMEHVMVPGYQIKSDWIWREQAFKAGRLGDDSALVKPRVIICDETGSLQPELTRLSDEVQFVEAANPEEAVSEIQDCPAHAILINAATPSDALAWVEETRNAAPRTPILGCSVPRTAERAISAGALGHLVKPVTRADLERVIQAVDGPVRRLLAVDDDSDFLKLLTRMVWIGDRTIEVTTASNGTEALEKLRGTPTDLVLLDIAMPEMNGWQVLESMRADPEIPEVPTFFVTAHDPAQQPPTSRFLLATMDEGLPLSKLLVGALQMSALLLKPEAELGSTLAETRGAPPASPGIVQHPETVPVTLP